MGLDRRIPQFIFNIRGKRNTFERKTQNAAVAERTRSIKCEGPGRDCCPTSVPQKVSTPRQRKRCMRYPIIWGGARVEPSSQFLLLSLAFDVTTQIGFQIIIMQQKFGDIDGLVVDL